MPNESPAERVQFYRALALRAHNMASASRTAAMFVRYQEFASGWTRIADAVERADDST